MSHLSAVDASDTPCLTCRIWWEVIVMSETLGPANLHSFDSGCVFRSAERKHGEHVGLATVEYSCAV